MKKLLLLGALLLSAITFAQVPQGVSYQAIALNSSGNPVVSAAVGLRLSVLNTSATGTVVYTETQTKTTNTQGLFNLVIGQGTPTSGTFAGINWATGSKFLKVEMDVAGGSNYVLTGTTQLLSVPYAMAAKSFVGAAGEGITLVSPNGTPYTLSVDNNGELSLPTAQNSNPGTIPSQLYLMGSFNSNNPATALAFGEYYQYKIGFKYFTSGTQIKFTASQTAGGAVYGGNGMTGELVLNGNAITIPSNGFYGIYVEENGYYRIVSVNAELMYNDIYASTMAYNTSGNYFNYTATTANNGNLYGPFEFRVSGSNVPSITFGDNGIDGYLDVDGAIIEVPYNASATSRLFRWNFNFNGTGTYQITP